MPSETWQSAPDAPGLWWRDGGDGPVAWEVRVSPLRRGGLFAQEAVGEECDTTYDLSPRSGVRWARCLPPEILAPGEATRAELAAQLAAVTAERDVLRAQQAPLLDAHDALVAAARAAGWTGAGATGAELVAWVRRGEREAGAVRCDAVAKGADNALPGREGDQRAYLKGRRRGAEVCAEALREGGE